MRIRRLDNLELVAENVLTQRRSIVQFPTLSTDRSALDQGLKAIGQLIRGQRIRRRLRSVDVAAVVGVSRFVLARVEAGKPIRTDSLLKILHGLGLAMGGRGWLEHEQQAENSAPGSDQQPVRDVPERELAIFCASQLRITPRRTPEDIRRAMSEGRFAEMTPNLAGYDEDEK